jgi:hypothetical protein
MGTIGVRPALVNTQVTTGDEAPQPAGGTPSHSHKSMEILCEQAEPHAE